MRPLDFRWWLMIVVSLSSCVSCQKEAPLVTVPLVLGAPLTVTPTNPIVRLGDTLWVEANFSDSLLDYNSGKRYRIRPQDMVLRTVYFIEKLVGVNQNPEPGASSFKIIRTRGQITEGGSFSGLFHLDYDGSRYRGKYGFIPIKRGVLCLSFLLTPPGGTREFNTFLPFIQMPPDSQGRPQRAELEGMLFIVNEGKANNFDLYQQHRQAFTLGPGVKYWARLIEQQGALTVEVK